MSKLTKALTAAAGNAGSDPLYAEDVFSTYLWEGTNSANTIENGIDLAGEGGLVWSKWRSITNDHTLVDTERGALKVIKSNSTSAQVTNGNNAPSSFLSNGFTYTDNGSGYPIASWTFRKAEKFFDVVTWTGTGGARTLSHNLGSTPSVIIVKSTTNSAFWCVYHSSLGATKYLQLSSTVAAATASTIWNDTAPTSTEFTVGAYINQSQTYVAYLFASDAGGFGDDGDENIIKCGSYTGNGGTQSIDVGFEPQFLLVKNASAGSTNWRMVDTMRGWSAFNGTNSVFNQVAANLSAAESDTGQLALNSTGFQTFSGNGEVNGNGNTIVYVAIRRPMKTPESGTEVFNPQGYTGNGSTRVFNLPLTPDMTINIARTVAGDARATNDRLRGSATELYTDATSGEAATGSAGMQFDYSNQIEAQSYRISNTKTYINYHFKRATGFFDVVAYSGDGTASRQITHNLGSAPDMIIVKCRNATNTYWNTWHSSLPDDGSWASNLFLNSTDGYAGYQRFDGAATQTADYFTTGNNGEPNTSGRNYIAYLFATLAGVSKVGSYTGTGSNVNVDCGFSAGARFILIKRTDSTGDWYVWDSVRGIVVGNDPYLLLNSTAAEVTNTDYIDPLASGFTVTSSAPAALNASGGTYIFLAIA